WPFRRLCGTRGGTRGGEVGPSLDGQGEWGGNLDIRDVGPGTRIFLPIFHPGALFYLGDVHASQGDTEFTGTAAETCATVRLRLDVVKGKRVPWMRIDKPGSIVAVHADRPLEAAVQTATFHLMDWLITEHGFSPTDAYCLVSTCPDFRINVYQICKIGKLSFVAGAEVPKRYVVTALQQNQEPVSGQRRSKHNQMGPAHRTPLSRSVGFALGGQLRRRPQHPQDRPRRQRGGQSHQHHHGEQPR